MMRRHWLMARLPRAIARRAVAIAGATTSRATAAAAAADVRDEGRDRARRRQRRRSRREAGADADARRLRARGQRPAAPDRSRSSSSRRCRRTRRRPRRAKRPTRSNETATTGRLLLFVVDEGSLRVGANRTILRTAQSLFNRLAPGDLVGLARLPTGVGGVEFTTDRKRVTDGLMKVTGAASIARRHDAHQHQRGVGAREQRRRHLPARGRAANAPA